MSAITLLPIQGLPEISFGDDLAAVLLRKLEDQGTSPRPGDILVIAHKIVSKAEGRVVALEDISPSPEALALGEKTGKPPALVQLVLEESERVVPFPKQRVLMARHRLGWTCANAGVDQSNAGDGKAVLLPTDPDRSAKQLSQELSRRAGVSLPVLISDTHGRPLRAGIVGVAVGAWGLEVLKNYVGQKDRFGHTLSVSREAVADELCAAASLCMGQGDESTPAVLVRGYGYVPASAGSAPLKRPPEQELFQPAP